MSNDNFYPTEPTVVFEEWKDPYQEQLEELKNFDIEDLDVDLDDDELDEIEETLDIMSKRPIKILTGDFGILPLTEQSLASSHFIFWTGHTNFKITHSIGLKIEDVLGVETLHVISPYRFRIGIGKLFRPGQVMHDISKAITGKAI